VGFPYHIQWIGWPKHSRDHEFTTSMDVMVSAGGRIFYIMDEGPRAIAYYLPSRWYLVARDAFNGVVLWKRPLANWRPYQVHGRKSLAADLWRRLVATDDEVYVTRTIFGPVIALDPETGKTLRTYEGTERTEEIIHDDGTLYLVATTRDPENIDRRQLATRRVDPDTKRLLAVDADTGAIRWTKEDEDTRGVHPLTLAAGDGRVLFQNTRAVVCLASATGKVVWRYARPSPYARPGYAAPTLVAVEDVVLSADRTGRQGADKKVQGRSELIALAADTGKELWRCPCEEGVGAGVDVFVAQGLVWVGEQPRRASSDYNHGRDLHTGEIRKTFSHEENWPTWHHHRCYRDKATEKYILAGRTGIEFVDLASGDLTPHHWVRGICEYGIMPCNGLIYSPPDQCGCYIESRLNGFHALAPKRNRQGNPRPLSAEARLEKGPAYSQPIRNPKSEIRNQEAWPTFRHDNRRSNHAGAEVPLKLQPAWNTKVGGRLTTLVCADGRLYLAQPDTHTVCCLDAETGRLLWRYEAGGRVDSPPTLSDGLAVFGCRDGYVYALRAADGELVWRFLAAPEDRRLVERDQVASVWPVHGSVLIEAGKVYFAAGRSSYLDGGMYFYKLDLPTGKTLLAKHYTSRDPKTGEWVRLFTPFDGECLPDRELPGLLPDVLSCDGTNLYMRAVPMTRDFAILDKSYVPHLFGSMGFLEDAWWERTYWIYGSHFYSGARGHGYAKTLYPAGRLLTFDETSVYGYQDAALDPRTPGIFRVAKNPEFIDLAEALQRKVGKEAKTRKGKKREAAVDIARTFVWKNGIPQNPQAMSLTRGGVGDAVRRLVKYEYDWSADPPLLPNAMLVTDKTFWMAGPPRFREEEAAQYIATARTDRFELAPVLRDALDTFQGKKGGVLLATDKATGKPLAELKLPSSPVFDGMIAVGGRLFLALKNGTVVCMRGE